MTTPKKDFDCVAMKRRGAEAVRARLTDKTRAERLAYWDQRTRALRRRQTNVPSRSPDDE